MALAERLRAGQARPRVECLLWYHRKGKPAEHVQVSNPEGGPLEVIVRKPWGPQSGA